MNRITLSLSRSKDFLVVTKSKFDADGFAESTVRGVVAIQPGSNPAVMLEKAKTFEWHITDEADATGFASVTKGAKLTNGATQEVSSEAADINQEA